MVHGRHFSQIFLTRSQILIEIVTLVHCEHVRRENFTWKKEMPDPRFYLKLLFLVKCGHVQTVFHSFQRLLPDLRFLQIKCHFGPRFCTKLSFCPQQNVKTKKFTFSNNFHPIQDFNQTCHFGPPLSLFSHIFHLIPDFGHISYNFGTLGYSRN